MSDLNFIDVPVYRLPEDRYYQERESFVERHIDKLGVREAFEQDEKFRIRFADHLQSTYGGAWRYNEIIGYIRLYFFGDQVRGEWWRVSAKRVTKSRKKQFEWQTWKLTYERRIDAKSTSAEIYQTVLEYIDSCKQELKPWHIDTSLLETIGPYVNWKALVSSGREGSYQSANIG